MRMEHRVGQIWEDCDPRSPYRRQVVIEALEGACCLCRGLVTGRLTRINVGGLRHPIDSSAKSGYRLVKDVP